MVCSSLILYNALIWLLLLKMGNLQRLKICRYLFINLTGDGGGIREVKIWPLTPEVPAIFPVYSTKISSGNDGKANFSFRIDYPEWGGI
jgi:hypothetical protein